MGRGLGYTEGEEQFGCHVSSKIRSWYGQHMDEHCCDAEEFLQPYSEGVIFLKFAIIFCKTSW